MSDKGTIVLGQKEYTLVAKRVEDFREKHPDYFLGCVDLRVEEGGGVFARSELRDTDGRVVAVGHGMIADKKPFRVERAETKANGRALAFYGFGGSDFSIASAEEMEEAAKAEKELAAAYQRAAAAVDGTIPTFINTLRDLAPAISRFFEDVLVMAEDQAVRENRLALLQHIASLTKGIADLSALEGF